ncbi:MAG: lysoplasmalogenase [Microthrixaceae bacterium]
MFAILVAATLVVAVADWVAVATDRRPAEYVLKPLAMVVLVAAAIVMSDPDPELARWLIVAGLVLSLGGDVFLMLEDHFVEGLASFLLAHVFYIAAFATMGLDAIAFVIGAAAVAVLVRLVGVRIVRCAAQTDRAFGVPVAAYVTVISLMVAFAVGTTRWWAIVGAALFYLSDALIGWSRFVSDFPHQRIAIMTTYHLGQVGIVLSLLGAA